MRLTSNGCPLGVIATALALVACAGEEEPAKKQEEGGVRGPAAVGAKQLRDDSVNRNASEAVKLAVELEGVTCNENASLVAWCKSGGGAVQWCQPGSWFELPCRSGSACGLDPKTSTIACFPSGELVK